MTVALLISGYNLYHVMPLMILVAVVDVNTLFIKYLACSQACNIDGVLSSMLAGSFMLMF